MDWVAIGRKNAEQGVPVEETAARLLPTRPSLRLLLDGYGVDKTNPARETLFDRCVRAVKRRGGSKAKDPRAICAAAGRRKYGQKEMTKRALAGRRRAARMNLGSEKARPPHLRLGNLAMSCANCAWFDDVNNGCNMFGGYSVKPTQLCDEWHKGKPGTKKNSAEERSGRYKGSWFIPPASKRPSGYGKRRPLYRVTDSETGQVIGEYSTKREGLKELRRLNGTRMNPAEAAAQVFQEFHGEPSSEVVSVTERIHHHEHLAAAGKLGLLVIEPIKGDRYVELKNFRGTLLTFNEQRNQLFLSGGDQSVDLRAFGITEPHEVETLGEVIDVDYETTKRHVGKEGGRGVYRHRFRTTNEMGRHITIEIARNPDLIYYVLDERLVFSGGSYRIIAEGIDR